MMTTKIPATAPRARSPADVRLAGAALAFVAQHEPDGHSAAMLALVQKYEGKIKGSGGPDVHGYLVQLVAEAFGVFTDRLARGYTAWASTEVIQCPSCEGEMHEDHAIGDFACGDCGYREKR